MNLPYTNLFHSGLHVEILTLTDSTQHYYLKMPADHHSDISEEQTQEGTEGTENVLGIRSRSLTEKGLEYLISI